MLVIPHDKALHVIYGVVIFAVCHLVLRSSYSLLVVSTIAFAKEIYDRMHPESHSADINDYVATIVGGVLGFICGLKILI